VSALEALCDYALYKSTFTLHYITLVLDMQIRANLSTYLESRNNSNSTLQDFKEAWITQTRHSNEHRC